MAHPRDPTSDEARHGAEDLEIALRFRRGDRATTRQVRRRVRKLVSYRRYGMSLEDRRDVEQEVMTQVWQATRASDGRFESGFWGFVDSVAIRRCIDWLRTHRDHDRLDPGFTADDDPLEQVMTKERSRLAASVVDRLDAPCRHLIELRVAQHRSYREIAELLGKSEGALRVKMHRCIERAGKLLREAVGSVETTTDRPENEE